MLAFEAVLDFVITSRCKKNQIPVNLLIYLKNKCF